MKDLYSIAVPEGAFTRACGGNLGGENETCVDYALLEGGGVALRDSKNPGAGEQRYSLEELRAFAADLEAKHGVTL